MEFSKLSQTKFVGSVSQPGAQQGLGLLRVGVVFHFHICLLLVVWTSPVEQRSRACLLLFFPPTSYSSLPPLVDSANDVLPLIVYPYLTHDTHTKRTNIPIQENSQCFSSRDAFSRPSTVLAGSPTSTESCLATHNDNAFARRNKLLVLDERNEAVNSLASTRYRMMTKENRENVKKIKTMK